jgi:hypothetical protein
MQFCRKNQKRKVMCITDMIFIGMKKLTKYLVVRITEQQFKKLAEVLLQAHVRKSALLREIIDDYITKKYGDN